ncbi:hypothetical protein EXIGUO9Y_300005 [Exiguobacterium oxidotolerans]|uniref:Uncharacterized protein n=1 Tax=Exiguobacterium oxidotolerans TaxID=223958 RepID=A0A653IDZ1_9BACL|nr:hypothetical protein EXIGUO9Y_300005 [Exiguobacterium oxidotolerans]
MASHSSKSLFSFAVTLYTSEVVNLTKPKNYLISGGTYEWQLKFVLSAWAQTNHLSTVW